MSEEFLEDVVDIFEEPSDFRPPPPESHFVEYERKVKAEPKKLKLRLVGKSPLWGHLLWNAGIFTADFLDKHASSLIENKRVLELGAAAGLPSIVCSINKAQEVISTDYPDPDLISNIEYNIQNSGLPQNCRVKGYIWGNDVTHLMVDDENQAVREEDKFDLVILSDLIFNHTEHLKLLKACRETLKKDGKCLVVFSPHRAHLLHKDMEFFETCKQFGFESEKIDMVTWTPMFEEEEETVDIRSRVYAFFLLPTWS